MDNIRKKEYYYILLAIAGAAMFIISLLKGTSDSCWPGMGLGFVIISALRLVQIHRYRTDEGYAKKTDIENSDERNRFLAEKARSMTFSYSILLEAVAVIILRIMGRNEASTITGLLMCAQLSVYWAGYFYLKRKY